MGKFFGNKKKNTGNSVGNVKTETIIDQNGDISIVSKNFTITTNQAKKEATNSRYNHIKDLYAACSKEELKSNQIDLGNLQKNLKKIRTNYKLMLFIYILHSLENVCIL